MNQNKIPWFLVAAYVTACQFHFSFNQTMLIEDLLHSSSVVESGFSVMNRIRGKVRWLLKPPAVQGKLYC